MMLARGTELLEDAHEEGRAIGAFSVYNLEGAQAVCRAAEEEGAPVIMQAGSSAFGYAGRGPLMALAVAAAESSEAQVGVHLDHSRDLEEVRRCLEHGYTSVMIDGSSLSFDENVNLTKQAAKEAHDAGAWIEAELGGLGGNEDRSGSGETTMDMTDPQDAARFVEATGVDALAVALGNVHGFVPYEVKLDLDRLAAIRELVAVPLVLHGASGLPEDQVRDAIALGVAKINVNAELRRAFREGVAESVESVLAEDDGIATLLAPATERMKGVVREKIRSFSRRENPGRNDIRSPTPPTSERSRP